MADELPELLPGELVGNAVAIDKLTNNAGNGPKGTGPFGPDL